MYVHPWQVIHRRRRFTRFSFHANWDGLAQPFCSLESGGGRGEAKTHSEKQISGSGRPRGVLSRHERNHRSSSHLGEREQRDGGEERGEGKGQHPGWKGRRQIQSVLLFLPSLFCRFADQSSPTAALSNRKRRRLGPVLWAYGNGLPGRDFPSSGAQTHIPEERFYKGRFQFWLPTVGRSSNWVLLVAPRPSLPPVKLNGANQRTSVQLSANISDLL